MKIRIGDRVKFLNEVGEGHVVSVINKTTVNVETLDGFEVPMLTNQLLIVDAGQEKELKNEDDHVGAVAETEEDRKQEEEEVKSLGFVDINQIEGQDQPDYFLAFVPESEDLIDGGVTAYLVNNSNYTLLFQYAHRFTGRVETIETGTLEPNLRIPLKTYQRKDINELPEFVCQLIPFRKRMDELDYPIRKEFSINAVKFAKESSYEVTSFFKKKAMVLSLIEKRSDESTEFEKKMNQLSNKEIKKQIYEKEREERKPKKQSLMMESLNMREIDLHIHELLDDTRGLSNTEMLKIQLEELNAQMKRAISDGVKKIVFIHGKGNGTLKTHVLKELQRKFHKYRYQDASFEKYGYGATLIILK